MSKMKNSFECPLLFSRENLPVDSGSPSMSLTTPVIPDGLEFEKVLSSEPSNCDSTSSNSTGEEEERMLLPEEGSTMKRSATEPTLVSDDLSEESKEFADDQTLFVSPSDNVACDEQDYKHEGKGATYSSKATNSSQSSLRVVEKEIIEQWEEKDLESSEVWDNNSREEDNCKNEIHEQSQDELVDSGNPRVLKRDFSFSFSESSQSTEDEAGGSFIVEPLASAKQSQQGTQEQRHFLKHKDSVVLMQENMEHSVTHAREIVVGELRKLEEGREEEEEEEEKEKEKEKEKEEKKERDHDGCPLSVKPSCSTSPLRPCIKKSFSLDDIPVCMRRRSWKQLPKPDLDAIRSLSVSPHLIMESIAEKEGNPLEEEGEAMAEGPKVKFASVHIRNYNQTIGDNPSVSIGPPISLDWDYEQLPPFNIDEFEEKRGERRKLRNMILSYYHRRNVLSYVFGYTDEQLLAAEKDVNKEKRRRAITRTFLPAQKVEEVLQSAGRKTKRYLNKRQQTV